MATSGAATGGQDKRIDGGALRVLVVDNEPTLAELLTISLQYEGWEACDVGDGRSAIAAAAQFQPDVVVLDVMLPDIDGLEVLRRLRSEVPGIPVLFLTARDAVEDRVRALTAGGDDYMTKPFTLAELVARLRVLMLRAGRLAVDSASCLVVGDLSLDEQSREVRRGDRPIALTTTEFELLRYLMHYPRLVHSDTQILDRVWNYDFGGNAHVVELYISSLRKKIDAGRAPMIRTVRGVGYILEATD